MCHTWMLHIRLGNNSQPNEEKKAKKTGRGISFVITLWVCCSSAHCSNKCGHDIGIHFFSLSLSSEWHYGARTELDGFSIVQWYERLEVAWTAFVFYCLHLHLYVKRRRVRECARACDYIATQSTERSGGDLVFASDWMKKEKGIQFSAAIWGISIAKLHEDNQETGTTCEIPMW